MCVHPFNAEHLVVFHGSFYSHWFHFSWILGSVMMKTFIYLDFFSFTLFLILLKVKLNKSSYKSAFEHQSWHFCTVQKYHLDTVPPLSAGTPGLISPALALYLPVRLLWQWSVSLEIASPTSLCCWEQNALLDFMLTRLQPEPCFLSMPSPSTLAPIH